MACVELRREIGNSAALRPFAKREVMPGHLNRADLENFVRDGVTTYWHQTGTGKMGRDRMAVVDGNLRVTKEVSAATSANPSPFMVRRGRAYTNLLRWIVRIEQAPGRPHLI